MSVLGAVAEAVGLNPSDLRRAAETLTAVGMWPNEDDQLEAKHMATGLDGQVTRPAKSNDHPIVLMH